MTPYINEADTMDCPLPWQKQGLTQTASGYGSKLTTTKKVRVDGRWYRVYCSCYANNGTTYIIIRGKRVVVRL